ncbi:MAG: gas vesicle protein [Alphaproteobacteria bacterium]
MARANQAKKTREKKTVVKSEVEIGTQQELESLPHAEKLMAFTEKMTSDSREVSERADTTQSEEVVPEPVMVKRFSAAEAARLVGMSVDSVSSVSRSTEGWDIIVNVVELARIPHSTDVLAAYNVNLDGEGNLMSYSRGNRYTRDQTGDLH